ncbi:MAG TPA: ABC transporter ATP-binding protein [Terriglobales bacterium]|nr:ABC transporter ATP-binding protein [Terriglobales bacterium]
MAVLLRALRALFPLLRLQRWMLAVIIVLGVLTALSEGLSISLLVPLIQNQMGTANAGVIGRMTALFQGIPADRRLWWIGVSILMLVVLKNILSYSYSLLFQWVNASISHRLRCGIFHQLLSVSQSYLDGHDSGKLLNTLGTDTWRVSSAFAVLANMIINACMTLTLGSLLLLISWKLTLITGCLLLLISQIVQRLTGRAKQLGLEATAASATLSQRMLETFHGLRLVRAFGRESHEQNRFDVASGTVRKIFWKLESTSALVHPLSEVLTASLLLGIVAVMAMRAPGQMAASLTFLILLYRLQPRIRQFDSDRVALNAFSASVEEVRKLLDETDKPYLRSGARVLNSIEKGIVLENVSLCYDSAKGPALDEVTCSINSGETTALVGPSGAGKSSLISLVCRFYDPSSGRLLIDGIPLQELDLARWRSQIAVVSQDVYLFNASVAENIIYGKLDATREELFEAARKAHALEFIENLPDGFETVLGDWGLLLSGGQRQRVALARAFIRDPQILILDEATNSLDLISETVVQDALEEFGRGRTVVIIAHRISTIEHADKVIVLDSGKVVESGSVTQLLSKGGLFSRFYALQLRKTKVGRVRAAPSSQEARPDLAQQKP